LRRNLACLALRVTDKASQPLHLGREQKIAIPRCCVVRDTLHCGRLSAVKTDYGYRAYDVFRLEDGAWVWCGYGNGRAILPEYVCKRLAEGRPVECVVNGYRYCIKPPTRGQSRSETLDKKAGAPSPQFYRFLSLKERERALSLGLEMCCNRRGVRPTSSMFARAREAYA